MKVIISMWICFLMIFAFVAHEIKGDVLDDILNNGKYELIESTLEEEMLSNLPREQLRKLRNMVFAKYGYKFKSRDLQNYLSQFQWYNPKYSNVDNFLTEDDKQIINYILFLEWNAGYRKMSQDYLENILVGNWTSQLEGQNLLEQGIYNIFSSFVFNADKSYVHETQTNHMSGSAGEKYEGEWEIENQKIYIMKKQYYSFSIESHAEAELQESEGTIKNPEWEELGGFKTYLPPFKERENATISLEGNLYKKLE